MAKLMAAEAPKPETTAKPYISRTWLSAQAAPTVETDFGTAKVFRIESGNGKGHTLLYIEGVDPNEKL